MRNRNTIVVVFFFTLLCLTSSLSHAAIIHVGPEESYSEIQPAIDAASAGDTIIVRTGAYTGANNKNLDFSGKAIALRSEGGAANCIIDCEYQGRGFYFHTGEGSDSILDGFTIRNGSAESGGGIFCYESSPAIMNCVVSDSVAQVYGGGIFFDHNSLAVITDCVINGNSAWRGGGIYSHDGASFSLVGCALSGNLASEYGGAIMTYEADPSISNCIITGNSANDGGAILFDYSWGVITDSTVSGNIGFYTCGGIYCYECSPTITNCVVSENSTIMDEAGGIFCHSNASPAITGCTITDNHANDYGGGILCYQNSSPTVTGCAISGNRARMYGAGIFCFDNAAPVISNCIISGNTCTNFGGGIACSLDGSPLIVNCTISGNTASEGAGIYVHNSCSPVMTNCILWGDSSAKGREIYLSDLSSLAVDHSDVQGGEAAAFVGDDCTLTWGEDNIDVDPLFAGLDDYHLAQNSPCIDAGTDAGVYNDIDGDVRPAGRDFDVGADELLSLLLSQITLLGPSDVSVLSTPPTFSWAAQGGADNVFAVDVSFSADFSLYYSTHETLHQLIHGTSWTMPTASWNKIAPGAIVYWRVRGADLGETPLNVITSDQIWSFTKTNP